MKKKIFLTILLFAFINTITFSQDFGFGFDDPEESSSGVTFNVSGDVTLEFPFYFKDYKFLWEEIASANLDLKLSTKYIEAITSFNISYDSISQFWDKKADWGKTNFTPLFLNEAFIRAYLGPVNIEAGYRKLTWGRADSSGPLDVTNPVDYSDLRNITDLMACKIARPMLHITLNTGSFSKLEGVFIPNFTPHRFAQEGRWAPSQYNSMPELIAAEIYNKAYPLITAPSPLLLPAYQQAFTAYYNQMTGNLSGFSPEFPDTSSLKYFQAGVRYTATIGPLDVGAQYYYGNLFRPNFTVNGIDNFSIDLITGIFGSFPPNQLYQPKLNLINQQIKYTRYHQFGVDYAQVLFGFNIRAELAFNLTEDYNGSDPALQNPFIAWSLGFDRDLFWGINLNLQCNETIRLFNGKVGSNPLYDCEAGTNVTSTRLTARLSKAFLRDDLQTQVVFLWDIENSDFYIVPSVTYLFKSFIFDITAGIFAGNKNGELGQYHRNSFIRLSATFVF